MMSLEMKFYRSSLLGNVVVKKTNTMVVLQLTILLKSILLAVIYQ